MPRRKRRPAKEIPEELPEEEAPLGEEEIPRAELEVPPVPGEPEDRETQWAKIETEVAAIKDDFIAGRVTLNDAIDRIVTALNAMREAPGLGGLGPGPGMIFPPGPSVPPTGPAIPPEEIPPVPRA